MLYQEIKYNEDLIDGVNSLSSSSTLTNQKDGYSLRSHNLRCLFVLFAFVALRPMSTAMVIAGRSVHLTTLLPGQA